MQNKGYCCMECGTPLAWESDYMASEVGLTNDDVALEEDWMVALWRCPYCGMTYEIGDCPPEERKNYSYYDKKNG